MASDPMDRKIMEAIKVLNPSGAYLMGFEECAGKLFIPSEANVRKARVSVLGLRTSARTKLQLKVIDSMDTALAFDEPQPVLDDIIGTIFAHLAKEGVNEAHMLSLLDHAGRAIDASSRRFSRKKITPAVKALVLYRLGGVLSILDTVKGQTDNQALKAACDSVKTKTSEYVKLFELQGWGHGEFPNVEKIFRDQGFDLGRRKFYPTALRKGFDYTETPERLEKNAISWIDEELPRFRAATAKLAKKYGCKATPEEVDAKITERGNLDPKKLVAVTMEIRKVVQKLVSEDIHGINPKYNTKVIETPPYLTGVIPTGAAQFFDTYTKKPFQYFFQTTDPKRDPDRSLPALLNLLVHEEYGHCVHHSNSAVGFVGRINPVQLLPGNITGAPITEGLSFNRELEFFELSKALEGKKKLSKAEKAYVRLLEKYGGLKAFNEELEFMTRKMRMTRFLRVVGDVRVNTGKQGLIEFLDWANKYTGTSRSHMYFQLFPAHEGIFPGYATTYAVVGQQIRAIEKKIKDPKKRVKFSTYLCSIGFPPRSIYGEMLEDYAAKLR